MIYITYLLSHNDNRTTSVTNPVKPPAKKLETIPLMLPMTSMPSQPVPKTTCESTPTDINPANTAPHHQLHHQHIQMQF